MRMANLQHYVRRTQTFFGIRERFPKPLVSDFEHHTATQSRFLVKRIDHDSTTSYSWSEMTFFSRWTPNHSTVLCMGVPSSFTSSLLSVLVTMWDEELASNAYAAHVPLIETLISMHNHSIWQFRDEIRNIERVCFRIQTIQLVYPRYSSARTNTPPPRSNCTGPFVTSIQYTLFHRHARHSPPHNPQRRNPRRDHQNHRSHLHTHILPRNTDSPAAATTAPSTPAQE